MFRVRLERLARGWSLVRVCQLTGLDPANMSKIERGLIPAYPSWRRRLVAAFGLTEEELFREVQENEQARDARSRRGR